MQEEIIKFEAEGEFPFRFFIEKAQANDEDSEMIIEGIASTTNIDHDKERMSKEALMAMESAINKEGVPLRVEHQKEGDAIIGKVFKAWVDERNQLHMKARLDKAHPVSSILHNSIKQGVKMGLSVGGLVKHAVREFSEATGGMIKTFYDVALQEVSVTPRPSNYDSWLIAKSIAKDEKDAENYRENNGFFKQFMFENPNYSLDYLQSFAKSVPDKAWRKVDSPIIKNNEEKNMSKEDMKKEEKKDTDETTKYASQVEFNSLKKGFKDLVSAVTKGFESIGKAMDSTPKDTTNPDKAKPEDETQQKAKAMDGDAMDANNPDKKKPDDESPTAKAVDETEDETKKMTEDEEDETKKAKETDDTYDIETLNRAIKSMDSLTKRMKKADTETEDETKKNTDEEDETKKAKEDETEEKEMTTKAHPLDEFIAKTTLLMEAVVDKMEKSGKRVLGFEKSFVDDLQKNPEAQAELAKLLKVPGFKKSVSMGVPYMVTKEGKRFPLVAVEEKVQKSDNSGKDFKSVYKSDFSSVSSVEE